MVRLDLTRPEFIIIIPGVSLLLCGMFFYDLKSYVYLNAILSFFGFFVFSYFFMYVFKVTKKRNYSMRNWSSFRSTEHMLMWIFIINAFLFSGYLVFLFSFSYGFSSILYSPYLLQTKAIVNSAGNFLHLNISLLTVFLILVIKNKSLIYFIALLFSLFFLYFAGIKGYIFQSILLAAFFFLSGIRFSRLVLLSVLGIFFFIAYFVYYDINLDKSASTVGESVYRFLAYFSGSWATFEKYVDSGWESPYPGLLIFSAFYKVASFGDVSMANFNVFFNINGFNLNVVPIFQSAYLDGGLGFQLFYIVFMSFVYAFLRWLSSAHPFNLFFEIAYVYFCSTLVLSMFFSNIFSALTFYISMFSLLVIGFSRHIKFDLKN